MAGREMEVSEIVLPANAPTDVRPGREPVAHHCHVTVQCGRRRADLALPCTVPILEVTPHVAALLAAGQAPGGERNGHSHGTPPVWALTRPGRAAFDLSQTLEDVRVLDGEVLHLVDVAAWRAPVVSDIADAVAEAIDGEALRWPGEVGRWLLGGLGVACLVGAGWAAASASAFLYWGAVPALVLAGLLDLTALLSQGGAGRGTSRQAVAGAAVALTAMAAWGMVGGRLEPVGVEAGAAGALVALLVVGRVVPTVVPGGALASAVLAVGAGLVARGIAPAAVAAAVAVAGVVALRLWPPVVGRLLSALAPAMSVAMAEQIVYRTRRLLASLSAATAVLLLGAMLVLLASGGAFAAGLALVCGLALALRARTYRFLPEALPAAGAAAVGLLSMELVAAQRWLLPGGRAAQAVVLLVSTGLVALAGTALVPERPPAPGRGVRLAWLAVDLAMAPLALGTLGVFDMLARLVHHFIR